MQKIIARSAATTVSELIEALKDLTTGFDQDVVYVRGTTGESLHLSLIENILSDGSITHDIVIREHNQFSA